MSAPVLSPPGYPEPILELMPQSQSKVVHFRNLPNTIKLVDLLDEIAQKYGT
eukprot:gene1603-12688_t